MSILNLSIAQQNVAKSHTFINNISFLSQKKYDLYVICEPPAIVNDQELGLNFYPKQNSNTMIVQINSKLPITFLPNESNFYVTTVFLPTHKIKIHSVYIPPQTSKYATTAEGHVDKIFLTHAKSTLILGDVNATTPLLGGLESTRGMKLTEMMAAYNWSLLNTINVPTRKQTAHAIDWSISSKDLAHRFTWKCSNSDKSLSDHSMIYLHSDFEQEYDDHSRVETYVNISSFIDILKRIDRSFLVRDLVSHLDHAVNSSICTKRRKWKQSFYDETCMASKRVVRSLLRKVSKHGPRDSSLAAQLKLATQVHQTNVANAKEKHWANSLKKCCHVGDVFVLLKKNRIRPASINHVIDGGTVHNDPETVAQLVLNHFFPSSSSGFNLHSLKSEGSKDPVITEAEVSFALSQQRTNTPGHDQINLCVAAALHYHFPGLLLDTFNLWFQSESMPSLMKKSVITLIVKNQEANVTVSNLRPISLIPIIAKIYERILAERIIWSISRVNALFSNQWGFSKGRSIEDAIRSINDARRCTNSKRDTVIALDVSGAFDNITHRSIIRECTNLKLSRSLINNLIDYLSDRRASLALHPSHSVILSKGVPQGSVLGPLLFNISFSFFLNTIQSLFQLAKLDASVVAFADDCTVVLRHELSRDHLTHTLLWLITQVQTVLANIGLKLNLRKTQIIDSGDPIQFTIEGFTLSSAVRGTILGIAFQSYAQFPFHIRSRVDQMEIRSSMLKSYISSPSLSLISRKSLVRSSVYSKILFAVDTLVTKPITDETIRLFLALDRKICAHLYGTSFWASYRAVISILGRDSLLYHFIHHATRRNMVRNNITSQQFELRSFAHSTIEPSRRRLLSFDLYHDETDILALKNVDLLLFTDGSKVKDAYCTTAAFVTWSPASNEWNSFLFKLPAHASAFQCERHAIHKAVCFILEELSVGRFKICSDSRSVLQSITGTRHADALVNCIYDKIHECAEQGKLVSLAWVKGHSTIIGNKLADEACHLARENELTEETVPRPRGSLHSEITLQADELFLQVTSQYFTYDSNYLATTALSAHSHGIALDYFTAAFFSARVPTRIFLNRLRLSSSTKCDCGAEQSIRHILIYCPLIINQFSSYHASSGLTAFLASPRNEEEILTSLPFHKYLKCIARPLLLELESRNGCRYVDVRTFQAMQHAQECSPGPSKKRKTT